MTEHASEREKDKWAADIWEDTIVKIVKQRVQELGK